MKASKAECAFAVDSNGLTLATKGKLKVNHVESAATRLMILFEQSSKVDITGGELRSILLEFDYLWLTGLSVVVESQERFTVGILAREPVPSGVRRDIKIALKERLKSHFASRKFVDSYKDSSQVIL